jgi:hypothetical protein
MTLPSDSGTHGSFPPVLWHDPFSGYRALKGIFKERNESFLCGYRETEKTSVKIKM